MPMKTLSKLFPLNPRTSARIPILFVITAFLSLLGVACAQTVVWSENFDDGNGNNRWYADNGVWQIGSPTIGPETNSLGYRTHSGPYCATTGLTANYPAGANSRLIRLQSFTVPATNQYPRLRFWHWYDFAGNCGGSDYGVVEVKGTNGVWQSVSPGFYGYSGDWTYDSVDLRAYAGQTVQVAFHIVWQQNTCGNNAAPGWYVDDILLETGTPVFNNPEGFENGIGDWYAETGTWQVGVPTSGPGAAHSGTNCAATILNGNYPAGANSRFVSPAFVVPSASSSPYLRFWHWFSFACNCGGCDYGVVEIIGTNGTWQPLSSHYSGTSGGWSEPALDLSAYAGQTVQFAFHIVWQQNTCGNNAAAGWYVDDVSIQSFGSPVIETGPASQTLSVGSSATLNVSASGDSPLSYQWRFNSNAIADATNAELSFANLQLTNTGYYDVVVTNDAGSITSIPPALLQVVIAFNGEDIGTPGAPGSFTNSNGTYTVNGSGEGTDGSADVFFFASQALAGDAEIIARLTGLQGGDPLLAEAAVMIRESMDPGSPQVSLSVNASTNVIFRRRFATDESSVQNTFAGTNLLQGTNDIWLRLMRMGNTFVAHYSTNGLNWQYMWFTTLTMSNQVQVGLGVTAHHYGELATAVFDNVSLGSLTPLPGAWPLAGPLIYLGGEPLWYTPLQQLGGFKMLVGGPVGDLFTIRASPTLSAPINSWPSLGTVTNIWGVAAFTDPQALTNLIRFYGAQQISP
jgi:hypothetical protein